MDAPALVSVKIAKNAHLVAVIKYINFGMKGHSIEAVCHIERLIMKVLDGSRGDFIDPNNKNFLSRSLAIS